MAQPGSLSWRQKKLTLNLLEKKSYKTVESRLHNEDILEEEDLGNDPEVMPRSSGSDFVISDDQGILRFLRKEKEFWDKISELL